MYCFLREVLEAVKLENFAAGRLANQKSSADPISRFYYSSGAFYLTVDLQIDQRPKYSHGKWDDYDGQVEPGVDVRFQVYDVIKKTRLQD